MFHRILVPLDGSRAAEMVLPYAVEISTRLGADIMLVSVSEAIPADTDHLYRSYLERVTERLQQELKSWGAKEEVKVRGEVLMGKPAPEILRYSDENKVGLIAMASRGRSGRGPWLLGNIAAKVLRAAGKPVLLVRAPATDTGLEQKRLLKRILVPLDGSRTGEAAIPRAEVLARALGAELVLFQVLEPVTVWAGEGGVAYATPKEEERRKAYAIAYLDSVAKQLKERGLSTSIAIGTGSAADQIVDCAQAKAIDLIAMSSHGRSGIGRWVFGSVTDKVLHVGDTAVLVIPATAT